eukprot:gene28671-31848_t
MLEATTTVFKLPLSLLARFEDSSYVARRCCSRQQEAAGANRRQLPASTLMPPPGLGEISGEL